ncbi:hypothetical protein CNYM01_06214 [Colletotrichum nymphaeae SA-01]|uniref:Uncharacterized protein n=1 Tax=Colletotrichum nymphaeae SA-01 TaxID=1460502 RepID=A0A135SVR5_9PEZI|nr:hypothetical protein CNYM01_06214 [Colletotrichum nymphaeae SA-01]
MLWLSRRRGRIRMVSRRGGLSRRGDGPSWTWMMLRMGRKTWEVRRTGTSGVISVRRRRSRQTTSGLGVGGRCCYSGSRRSLRGRGPLSGSLSPQPPLLSMSSLVRRRVLRMVDRPR